MMFDVLILAPIWMEGRAARLRAYANGPRSCVAQASRTPDPHTVDVKA